MQVEMIPLRSPSKNSPKKVCHLVVQKDIILQLYVFISEVKRRIRHLQLHFSNVNLNVSFILPNSM